MSVFRKKVNVSTVLKIVIPLACALAVVLIFYFSLNNVEQKTQEESLTALENSVRRAVVHCYAVEGRYPPNLDYLTEHYGVQIDKGKYTVYYDLFASNLMPDITVLEGATPQE